MLWDIAIRRGWWEEEKPVETEGMVSEAGGKPEKFVVLEAK